MVRPLAARAKGSGSISCRLTRSEINFLILTYDAVGSLALSGLGPDNLGSIPSGAFEFNCIIILAKCYVGTLCPRSPSYPSFRVGKLVPVINWGNCA